MGTGASRLPENDARGLQVPEGGRGWAPRPCAAPDLGAQRRRRGVALLWSAGKEAKRDQAAGPGAWESVPRKDLLGPGHRLTLHFFDFISFRAPLLGVPTPGPGSLPALPWSSPGPRESTQPGEEGGGEPRVGGQGPGKGQAAPGHLGRTILIRSRPTPSWSGSHLVCPSTLRDTSFPGGPTREAAPAHAPGKKPRAEPPPRPEQVGAAAPAQ